MKTKTWMIFIGCVVAVLLFVAHVSFVNNDKFPEWLISQHIYYQLNQNSRLVLTYYDPPYSKVYQEIRISKSNLLSTSINYENSQLMSRGINGAASEQEVDNLLVNLFQIANDPWTIKSASKGTVLILSVEVPTSETRKYKVITCKGDGCPKELCLIFDLVRNISKREGKQYASLRSPISCSSK